jgi:hypothetical protein
LLLLLSQPQYIHWLKGLKEPPADQGQLVKALRVLLKSISDALTIITLAYVVNFGVSGKCTMSGYHYLFGINAMLMAFASITIYVTIVRNYWAAPVSALFRTIAHVVVFALVGRLLFYQWTIDVMPHPFYFWGDAAGRTDSALFLPMACFLDNDLNPLEILNAAQLDQVGHVDNTAGLMEPIVFIFLSVCFVLAHMAHLAHIRRRYISQNTETSGNSQEAETPEKMSGDHGYATAAKSFYFSIVLVCIAVNAICYNHLWVLHTWIIGSGWMERLPGSTQSNEEDLIGIGQLGYFCTLLWVGLLFFDELRFCCCCCFQRKDPKGKWLRGKGPRRRR